MPKLTLKFTSYFKNSCYKHPMDSENTYISKNETQKEPQHPPVEIPLLDLHPDILSNIIESFVMREGTDYGVNEIAVDTKISQVKKQIEKGDVKIVFDPNTESVTLMTKRDWTKLTTIYEAGITQ